MPSLRVLHLAGAVLVCVIALPRIVAADGRKNPRDFPANTLCPINLGWHVDPDTGTIVPPPAQPIRPPARTFTALGDHAEIRLVACDRGFTDDPTVALDVWIRDFAVVRQNVYESHQREGTYPDPDPGERFLSCYQSREFEADFFRKVGSVFDPSVPPAVTPETLKLPFRDDFSNLYFSQSRWHLEGAEFRTVDLNDPRPGTPSTGRALVLARPPLDDASPGSCSMASVMVRHLRLGQTYVIDYKWQVQGMEGAGAIDVLTIVDPHEN